MGKRYFSKTKECHTNHVSLFGKTANVTNTNADINTLSLHKTNQDNRY